MPPKKDAGKDKKKEKVLVGPPAPEVLSDQTKEFYIVQIKDLANRVDRYQKLCDELEVKNKEFRAQFDQLSEDKRDIVVFIKKRLEEKTDEIQDLNEQILGLQQAKDAERESFENQLQELRTEYHTTRDQLVAENMVLGGKLASLEDFKVQREELVAKMDALDAALTEQDMLHKNEVYALERKEVINKDRLKKDMITRVNQVAAEFRKASNRQMAETTKRTIRENISVSAQMAKMSEKTEELLEENRELKERSRKQKQQMELLEQTERTLARKNINNQKLIRILTEKCKEQTNQLAEYGEKDKTLLKYAAKIDHLQNKLAQARPDMAAEDEENRKLVESFNQAKAEYDEGRATRIRIEKTINNAAEAVKAVITSRSTNEECPETLAEVAAVREGMMESLLAVLNGAANCAQQTPTRTRSASSAKHHQLDERYAIGDAGLIPRPFQHIPSNTERMRFSEEAKLQALKHFGKTAKTEMAGQNNTTLFADQLLCKYPPGSAGASRGDAMGGSRGDVTGLLGDSRISNSAKNNNTIVLPALSQPRTVVKS